MRCETIYNEQTHLRMTEWPNTDKATGTMLSLSLSLGWYSGDKSRYYLFKAQYQVSRYALDTSHYRRSLCH